MGRQRHDIRFECFIRAPAIIRKTATALRRIVLADTPEGACPNCHGIVHAVDERSLVPDETLTIRQRAVATWPSAWQGQNLRDILVTLGYDVDKPWRELPKKFPFLING